MPGSIGRTEMGSDPRAAFVHGWKGFIFTFVNETWDVSMWMCDVDGSLIDIYSEIECGRSSNTCHVFEG